MFFCLKDFRSRYPNLPYMDPLHKVVVSLMLFTFGPGSSACPQHSHAQTYTTEISDATAYNKRCWRAADLHALHSTAGRLMHAPSSMVRKRQVLQSQNRGQSHKSITLVTAICCHHSSIMKREPHHTIQTCTQLCRSLPISLSASRPRKKMIVCGKRAESGEDGRSAYHLIRAR